MNKKIFHFVIWGLLPFLAGCIDTNDQFTVNPDGSGKVVHEAILTTISMNNQTPQDALKGNIKRILQNTTGVDAWKDVTYKIQDDGKTYFKGTAYFPDINNLKIDNLGTTISNLDKVSFQMQGPDHMILEFKGQANAQQKPAGPVTAPKTQEEIDKEIAKQKQQYQLTVRPLLTTVMASLRVRKSFILPGQIETVTNFQKNADGSFGIDFEGSKILGVMDDLVNDQAYLLKVIKEGGNFTDGKSADINMMNEKLYGQAGPVRAVLAGPFKPLFDYDHEMQEAKKEYIKIRNDLDINNPASPDFNSMPGSKVSIILKNGTTVEGKVVEKTKDYVKLEFQGMALTYYNDEIEKINTLNSNETNQTPGSQPTLSFQAAEPDSSCGSLKNASSEKSAVPVQFTVRNGSKTPLVLCWINFEGEQKKYAEIPADGSYKQQSFSGHVWEIDDRESGNCIGEFQLGASGARIDVR
jgi:VHL beta domain